MKRALLIMLILFSALAFTEGVKYTEKVEIIYVIYEGFYASETQAKENIELIKVMNDFEDMKIIEKTIRGAKKYGIFIAETDSYSKKNYFVSKLKKSRFGAQVYQKKRRIRIPVKEDDPNAEDDGGKKEKRSIPTRRRKLKMTGLIKKEKRKIPGDAFVAGGASAVFGGLSYMYYSKAAEFHSEYVAEQDPDMILGLWDGVEVNRERYVVYMSASVVLGVFSLYQFIWGNRPEIGIGTKLSLVPRNDGERVCLSLDLKF